MSQAKKGSLNPEAFIEQVLLDPELIVEGVRTLIEVKRNTQDKKEKAKIRKVLSKLCGKLSDPTDPVCYGGYRTRKTQKRKGRKKKQRRRRKK